MRDLSWRRDQFPALSSDTVYFDGPGGSQVPRSVVEATVGALHDTMSNTGWPFPGSERSELVVAEARAAVADLLGAEPDAVAFGGSMTAMTYRVAAAMAREWGPGDEVIVSELDHDANVRPWVQAAEGAGATVRWARIDAETCELPTSEFERLLSARTKVVAVTASSNVVGTRPDIPTISTLAHEAGALVYLDAVHAVPHGPVTLAGTGADIIACSAYKFFGPHLGCIASTVETLAPIHPQILAPAADLVPIRFELGTLPFEQLAGLTAAVDFLDELAGGTEPTRKARLARGMAEVDDYCLDLFDRLMSGLRSIQGVTVLGPEGTRGPTLGFVLGGRNSRAVAAELASLGFNVPSGNFYAYELMKRLGYYEHGGTSRIGLLHYNSADEVDSLLNAVEKISTTR